MIRKAITLCLLCAANLSARRLPNPFQTEPTESARQSCQPLVVFPSEADKGSFKKIEKAAEQLIRATTLHDQESVLTGTSARAGTLWSNIVSGPCDGSGWQRNNRRTESKLRNVFQHFRVLLDIIDATLRRTLPNTPDYFSQTQDLYMHLLIYNLQVDGNFDMFNLTISSQLRIDHCLNDLAQYSSKLASYLSRDKTCNLLPASAVCERVLASCGCVVSS